MRHATCPTPLSLQSFSGVSTTTSPTETDIQHQPQAILSSPPFLTRHSFQPSSTGERTRRRGSFDVERAVERCREVGHGWVSFAEIGVGTPQQDGGLEEEGEEGEGEGRKRWWSWSKK